jgi:hypothetical protein
MFALICFNNITNMMLPAPLLRKLKTQTGFKKVKGDDVIVLEVPFGSVALKTFRDLCPAQQRLKVRVVPYYGPRAIPEAEYGPVNDAIEAAVMRGDGHIPRGGARLSCAVLFKVMERIQRLPAIAPNTPLTRLLLHFDNCIVSILLKKNE